MPTRGDGQRAQGDVIGVVLLLAITITGATTVVAFGGDALGGIQDSATNGAAEQSLTQFDSKASLVAHGDSDSQSVTLAGSTSATRSVDPDAGWMNITIRNATTGAVERTLTNTTLGSVTYREGETTVAYQGGGVWTRTGNGSAMISPPEFHYRGTTLTLPLVQVTGDTRLGSSVVVRNTGSSTAVYPDTEGAADLTNPLDDGKVVVTVGSAYYEAWGQFFRDRTSGDVDVDHANETATIELIVPFDTDFDNVVATTAAGGISAVPGPPPSPYRTGVQQPSADDLIESKVNDCENGSCNTSVSSGTVLYPGTYYVDGDYGSDLEVDASAGDVNLVVNGDFEPGTVTVTGPKNFTAYVREDFQVSGSDSVNAGGDVNTTRVVVHSDGHINFNGKYVFVGFLYAPGSDIQLNGGGGPKTVNLKGGIVGETIDVNGKPNEFEYDPMIETINIDVTGSTAPRITFLHVSVTEVNVTDD
ncbi:DUF7289 family protein [Halobaculum limi]|uniref:DUF7289 family protein n=1 Tax=Halobaculum limi TaxID=3031916 RepID=UPI0024064635|nr:hypothetical protein [Halobaculum sp. YSMS11]